MYYGIEIAHALLTCSLIRNVRRRNTMIQRIRTLAIVVVILFSLSFSANASRAQQHLPALPSQTAINQVLNGPGPQYVTTGVPEKIDKIFKSAFGKYKPFKDIPKKQLDYSNAGSYFSLSSNVLRTLIPLQGASGMTLAADTQLSDGRNGKLIGGEYDTTDGAVLVFLVGSTLRFYSDGYTFTTPFAYIGHTLPSLTTADAGILIAADEACYEIGLSLVCFNPYGNGTDPAVATSAQNAYNTLAGVYSFMASFNYTTAVPDIVGANSRAACTGADNCQPNVVYVANGSTGTNQLIGMMNVLAANDLQTYDTNGNFIGQLPADAYLVIQLTASGAGTNGALFLVGAVSGHNYMIPARGFNGFGNGSNKAGVKDASMSGWWF